MSPLSEILLIWLWDICIIYNTDPNKTVQYPVYQTSVSITPHIHIGNMLEHLLAMYKVIYEINYYTD